MKIVRFRFTNSIFSRLVLTFTVIMVPIYILGLYMYNWGLSTVKSEISKSTIAQVSFYLEGLEDNIERIKILQYDCLNDENLNKLAIRWRIMGNYETLECMRQLQQKLVTIKNSSVYIKNVSVHIPAIKRTLSSNTSVDEIDLHKFQGIRVPWGVKGAQIISYKNGLYLSTLHMSNLSNNKPQYMIEIELDQDVLKQELSQFNTYKDSGSLLVSLINNKTIYNQSNSTALLLENKKISNFYNNDDSGMIFQSLDNKKYYFVYSKSKYLNMVLVRYIPEEIILMPLKNFYIWVWVFTIVAIVIILIYYLSTYNMMHRPLRELVKSFKKLENGDLQVAINHDNSSEFGYLYTRFNDMVKNLNMLIDQVYTEKILMQRAELKHLQSQINPHFLYNSFFMINTMAKVGDENLIPFSRYLGEYFRFVTRNSSDYIPLSEEINHAYVYAKIQLMRFSRRFSFEFGECPEAVASLKVPRLILQPIIENAFEHGIAKKKTNGIIKISYIIENNELSIITEDNGCELTDERLLELRSSLESNHDNVEITGLINIHRRLRMIYGDSSGLEYLRSDLGGLKVVLKIIIAEVDNHV